MEHYILPTSFTAGTVLLIGDQFKSLAHIRNNLSPDFFYRLFDEPEQAQDFLLKQYTAHIYQQPWITIQNNQQIAFSLETLSDEFNTSHRFEEISVVVIDNSMKKLSASAFCHNIILTDYKKILLVCPDEVDQAKQDIQSGVIDGYVVKDNSPALSVKLSTAISTMAFHYFQQAAFAIVKQLNNQLPQLSDMAFIDFFQTLCFDHHIVEFYLLDNQGSYLLLDQHANPFYLQVSQAPSTLPTTKESNPVTHTVYGHHTYYCCLSDLTDQMPIPFNLQEWGSFSTFCHRAAEYL